MPSTSEPFDRGAYEAFYFDGRRARRHHVTARLEDDHLAIVDTNGEVLDRWSYDDLELSDQGRGSVRIIKRGSEARLTIDHPRAFSALQARAPELISQGRRAFRNVFVAIAITMALIVGGYVSLPTLTSAVVAVIPLETEARIGEAVAEDVAQVFAPEGLDSVCESDEGRAALDVIVERLMPYQDGPFDYRVDVLDTPSMNALAMPGGRIFILRGVLDKAEDPGEVAAVLAHEMVHVNKRHGMKSMVRSYGTSFLADLMFGGSIMGNITSFAMFTSYSREAEQEADVGAIDALTRSGIGTAGMAAFFKRLQDEEGGGLELPEFFSTHPASGAREDLARHEAPRKGRGPVLDPEQWQALKTICGAPEGDE